MSDALKQVLDALSARGCKPTPSGDGYRACCPVHEGDGKSHTPSLSVRQGDQQALVMHCHAGCDYGAIVVALGLDGKPKKPERRIVATYSYRDLSGNEVRQKVRYEPKDFLIRHQTAARQWVYKAGPGPAVLYRLPEVSAGIAEGKWIVVLEGEKDVDRVRDPALEATTNIEGASAPGKKPKWPKEYTAQLSGAPRVVLVPDNDPSGRAHMQHIAQQLQGKVADLRWLELPGLPEKGDVSDWFNQGHTMEEFLALVEQAPVFGQEGATADVQADPPLVGEFIPVDEASDTPNPKPKKTLGQIVAILSVSPWAGVIGYNSFQQALEKRIPAPYGGEAGPWRDCDTAETMLHLEKTTGVAFGRDLVDLAVMTVAHRNIFNPAQDRLHALATQWDGQARLKTWLVDYLGAKANDSNREYLEEIGAAWLKGVCARVLFPGCKRDDVLVLRSPQGWRKSTAANAIADAIHPDSFTDSVDLNNLPEAKIQIRGVIIAELSELAGMGRAEVEGVKAFVATKQDRFREKFGRYAENFPRAVSFIGSTNDPNFLKDPTGNRRWWPVTLESPVDIPRLEAVLPQLIGEAARRVMRGHGGGEEPWHVTAEKALEQAEQVRSAHFDEDVWTYPVMRIVENMTVAGQFITTADILDSLQIPRVQQTNGAQKRVAGILKMNGLEEARRWLDKKKKLNQRYWKFSNTRQMVPPGYPVPTSEIEAKVGNHEGTSSVTVPVPSSDKIQNGNRENSLPVPTRFPSLASQEAEGTTGTTGTGYLYMGENSPAVQTDLDALVHHLKNGYHGLGRAALMKKLGWGEGQWEAAKEVAMGHGLIEVKDGRWYPVEGRS